MTSDAIFSKDRVYRYSLVRIWDGTKDLVSFIGLNPSTADETKDDPTIRRCSQFAKDWGYGGLVMLNLFAYRSTDPKALKTVADPVGPGNNTQILHVSSMLNSPMIAAWGTHGTYLNRGEEVKLLLNDKLHYLRLTKDGHPSHPLYLPKKLTPTKFVY